MYIASIATNLLNFEELEVDAQNPILFRVAYVDKDRVQIIGIALSTSSPSWRREALLFLRIANSTQYHHETPVPSATPCYILLLGNNVWRQVSQE